MIGALQSYRFEPEQERVGGGEETSEKSSDDIDQLSPTITGSTKKLFLQEKRKTNKTPKSTQPLLDQTNDNIQLPNDFITQQKPATPEHNNQTTQYKIPKKSSDVIEDFLKEKTTNSTNYQPSDG